MINFMAPLPLSTLKSCKITPENNSLLNLEVHDALEKRKHTVYSSVKYILAYLLDGVKSAYYQWRGGGGKARGYSTLVWTGVCGPDLGTPIHLQE